MWTIWKLDLWWLPGLKPYEHRLRFWNGVWVLVLEAAAKPQELKASPLLFAA
jgi:hypothetical protein